jgi:uncharacterized membrane protein
MSGMTTEQRDRIPRDKFAYVDKEGGEHLPIHDEEHVRNAISRWNQTDFENREKKEAARKKILSAARHYGIEMSDDDKIMKTAA